MKINCIDIEDFHLKNFGIQPIKLNNLSDTICFVGKNGAGKTRLLKILIRELKKNSLYNYLADNLTIKIEANLKIIEISKKLLAHKNHGIKSYNFESDNTSGVENLMKIFGIPNTVSGEKEILINLIHKIRKECDSRVVEIDYQKFKNLNANPNASFIAKENNSTVVSLDKLRDQHKRNSPNHNSHNLVLTNSLVDAVDAIYHFGINYLENLAKFLAYEKIKNFQNPEIIESTENYRKYISLNTLISQLLAKNIEYKIDDEKILVQETIGGITGKWFLNNRPFNYNDLSDGEKVLFTFALLLFTHQENNNTPIQESIIFIDEPETHLHPTLQILLIKRLKNILKGKGQLIVATHSIHIISSLSPEEIYLVEDDCVYAPSSKNINKIVESLVGIGDDFQKFKDFCFEEFDWGFRNFIAQCFISPEIISSAKENDPQVSLFRASIEKNTSISLLDFGAGGGRLGKEISEKIKNRTVEYSTYDTSLEFHDELKALGAQSIYSELNKIPTNTYDYVILCNVLHEIPLSNLQYEFEVIQKSLKESGFIVIIEDKLLSKGENAHAHGFLIFTEMELPSLLGLKSTLSSIKLTEERYSERIMCAIVSKNELNLNKKGIKKALSELKQNSYSKFQSTRLSNNENFKSLYEKGRISAFYSQQFMNASLASDEIDGQLSKGDNEIEASFQGDWKNFILSNVNSEIPVINNAPSGKYQVVIKFTINKDGKLEEILPETSMGYGMEEEVIRVLHKSPNWKPASRNGIYLNAYRKQPVTYIVKDKKADVFLSFLENFLSL